jgi:DNA modification methylase
MKTKILIGDCRERLKEIPDNSIDSIVTDPPYELGFMGKVWDKSGIAYDQNVWKECLRVLKPGGHLLAFSGSRTYHRMAVAIEDSGFEIRDQIMWVYSTGFPKSRNFGCKCSGGALPYTHEKEAYSEPQAKCNMHSLRDSDVSQALDTSEGRGQILQPCMSEQGTSIEGREQLSATKIRQGQSGVEGRGDALAETRELQADQIHSMPAGVSTNGPKRRVCDGTPINNGEDGREVLEPDRSGASCKPQSARQQAGESGTFSKQFGSQAGGMAAHKSCPSCGGLIDWQGWGTSLKPAHEPICMARKPFKGTVAENVLTHGTGALNVDGCRVGTEVGGWGGRASIGYSGGLDNNSEPRPTAGRWPANLIHDGSEEVLAGFPETGAGSAARFFYCAKASKKDRDEGLDTYLTTKLETKLCKEENMELVALLQKATSGLTLKWSIDESGKNIMAISQKGSLSTTLTKIKQIIESKTLSLSTPSRTSESTADAHCETARGGNPAANAGRSKPSIKTITSERMESARGVKAVALKKLLLISEKGNWQDYKNIHSTVKPTDLMRYLCRLVTPPNGTVLDPFMGSGSTGKAAMLEGFQFIGCELSEEYAKIAEARIAHASGEEMVVETKENLVEATTATGKVTPRQLSLF